MKDHQNKQLFRLSRRLPNSTTTSQLQVHKRMFQLLAAAVCAAVLTGCCCCGRSQFVVVPEEVFRTEKSITNRIRLPLKVEDRQKVIDFLVSGGNWRNIGGSPDPTTDRELRLVEPLLEFLTKHQLKRDDIESRAVSVVTSYFGRTFTHQIVDARNYDQRNVYEASQEDVEWGQYPPWPFALRHGRLWWVFFPNDAGRVTGLMLVAEIKQEKPKN